MLLFLFFYGLEVTKGSQCLSKPELVMWENSSLFSRGECFRIYLQINGYSYLAFCCIICTKN